MTGADGNNHNRLIDPLSASGVYDDRIDGTITLEERKYNGYREQSNQDRFGIYANTRKSTVNHRESMSP